MSLTPAGNPDGSVYGANRCRVVFLILKSRDASSSSSRSIIESLSRLVAYARMQSIDDAVRERGAAEAVTVGGEKGTAGASKVRRDGRQSRVSD